jgi:spore coat polysaccharide biosynthesis protein SpsF
MLWRQVERVRRSRRIDRLVIATSTDRSDNAIASFCAERDLLCFRGSLNDVLDRYCEAARRFAPDHVVRLTADCPLIDPAVIDAVIRFHLDGRFEYASNRAPPTFPDGLDVEVMYHPCLERAGREAVAPYDREHVTPYLYQSGLFVVGNYENDRDLSHLRWTVDTDTDFHFVERVYQELYPGNPEFDMSDVLAFLEREPGLARFAAPIPPATAVRTSRPSR